MDAEILGKVLGMKPRKNEDRSARLVAERKYGRENCLRDTQTCHLEAGEERCTMQMLYRSERQKVQMF